MQVIFDPFVGSLTLHPSSTGGITGTIAANQVAFGIGTNTIGSSDALTWNGTTFALAVDTASGDPDAINVAFGASNAATNVNFRGANIFVSIPSGNSNNHIALKGADLQAEHDGSGNLALMVGSDGDAEHYGSGTVTSLIGLRGIADNNNTGAVTVEAAFRGLWGNDGSGVVASAYGLQLTEIAGGGPITMNYGVAVPALSQGATNYGFYSAVASGPTNWAFYGAGTAKSHFGGNVDVPAGGLTIGSSVVTLAGNFTTSGAFAVTQTYTGATNVTFPTSGTLLTTTGSGASLTFPGTLVIASGKTATVNNTLTFTGTDSSSVAFGAGGTVAYTANNLSVFAATTSAQLAGVISDETGTGLLVFATAPSLTGPVTITEAVGSSGLTITGATQTSSFPALSAVQTWNASGTTFTGIKFNVTNTASANGSRLIDLQVGGTSIFVVQNQVSSVLTMGLNAPTNSTGRRSYGFEFNGANEVAFKRYADNFGAAQATVWRNDNSINTDTMRVGTLDIGTGLFFGNLSTAAFVSGGAGIIEQRATTTAQSFFIYNTFTSSTNFERLEHTWSSNVLHIGNTKGSGGGTARVLQIDYGGTTTAAISIPITSGAITFGGGITLSAADIATDTSTGTKIATATGQKLGFWNATPVAQQVLATGASHTVDDVISFLQTVGLCKQS